MDKFLVDRFHALGDPTRLAVIELLLEGEASVSELAAHFPITLPPFTKHLRVLENAKLVQSVKNGRVRTYRVSPEAFDEIDHWFRDRRRLWRARFHRLDQALQERNAPK